MCFNAGMADRIVRVVVGLAIAGYGAMSGHYIIGAIGIIPITTGAIGFCPLYPIFKVNTGCKND